MSEGSGAEGAETERPPYTPLVTYIPTVFRSLTECTEGKRDRTEAGMSVTITNRLWAEGKGQAMRHGDAHTLRSTLIHTTLFLIHYLTEWRE